MSTLIAKGFREGALAEGMGINYTAAATHDGERLTLETFQKYRKQGGVVVVIYCIPDEVACEAVANPDVIIASDGMPLTGAKVHPRGQGTYARVLGYYVREQKALDLMTALRKMSLMPAERLESLAPIFRNKGRIRVGATRMSPSSIPQL